MGNIPAKDGDLIWLDISKKHRASQNPYYTENPDHILHDNPSWGFLPSDSKIKQLVWRAYLYGFPTDNITRQPWVKLEWGFDMIAGQKKSIPFRPVETNLKNLTSFLTKLKTNQTVIKNKREK